MLGTSHLLNVDETYVVFVTAQGSNMFSPLLMKYAVDWLFTSAELFRIIDGVWKVCLDSVFQLTRQQVYPPKAFIVLNVGNCVKHYQYPVVLLQVSHSVNFR